MHFIKDICQVWQKYPASLQVLRLLIIANKKHFKKVNVGAQKRVVAVSILFLAESWEQDGLVIVLWPNPLYWPLSNLYLHMFL